MMKGLMKTHFFQNERNTYKLHLLVNNSTKITRAQQYVPKSLT